MIGVDPVSLAHAMYEDVDTTEFEGDPVANPRLHFEVVDLGVAADTPVLVLVTPWTLNGLAFPPDGAFPEWLEIDGRRHRVHADALEGLGTYRCVDLAPDVSHLPSQAHARKVAHAMGDAFFSAVERARLDLLA